MCALIIFKPFGQASFYSHVAEISNRNKSQPLKFMTTAAEVTFFFSLIFRESKAFMAAKSINSEG